MRTESRRLSLGLSLIVAFSLLFSVTPVFGTPPLEPQPDFTASPTRGYAPLKVDFTDLTTWSMPKEVAFGGPAFEQVAADAADVVDGSWLCTWDFGDGSTQQFMGTQQHNTSHIYTKPGGYTVKLSWLRNVPASMLPTGQFSARSANQIDYQVYSKTRELYIVVLPERETQDKDRPEPARMGVSYLNIDPVQVLPNQEVVVSANICNSGEERGSKTVSLLLNGEAVASQSVSVSGGACQQVIFKTSRAVPGTYQVAIDGMTGQFSVLAPRTITRNVPSQQQTGLGTAGIIAIIAVLIALIAALVMVFKRD